MLYKGVSNFCVCQWIIIKVWLLKLAEEYFHLKLFLRCWTRRFLLFLLYIIAVKFDVITLVLLRSIFLVSLRFCEPYLLGIEIEIIVCVKPLKLFKHFLNLTEKRERKLTTPLWKTGTHCCCNRHIRMLKDLEMIFPPLHTEKTPYWKMTKFRS